MQKRRHHGGIDSAGKTQQDLALAYLRLNTFDCVCNDVANAPESVAAADLANKPFQHPRALFRVGHFGMELNSIKVIPHN